MAAGRAGRAGQFNGMLKILPGFPAMSARRPSGIHCVAHFSGNAAAGILEFSLQVIHEEEEEEEEEEAEEAEEEEEEEEAQDSSEAPVKRASLFTFFPAGSFDVEQVMIAPSTHTHTNTHSLHYGLL